MTGLSQGFLSQLESGRATLVDIRKIIRFVDGLAIPEHLLPRPSQRELEGGQWQPLPLSPPLPTESHRRAPIAVVDPAAGNWPPTNGPDLGALEAIELLQRVEATDLGPATLEALASGLDHLCRAYGRTAPAEILGPIRAHQSHLARLLGGRATLGQRRELLRQAGWISLLAATAAMDVGHDRAATANLAAAHRLASEVDDPSLAAWTYETRAWYALARGDYLEARSWCDSGLAVAPALSSAHLQLLTQAARVSARLGELRQTHRRIDECMAITSTLPTAVPGDHHFACAPDRALAYCAAALVWLDADHPVAEDYARRAVAQYADLPPGQMHPHHLATTRMNLALLLAQRGELDEATHTGSLVFESSWRLCQTDLFLADDLDRALTDRFGGDPNVRAFHEQYLDVRRAIGELDAEGVAAPFDVGQ